MESKKHLPVIAVSLLLALAGIVCEILGNIQWMGGFYASPELIAYIIVWIATMYYVLIGYKKPHGNLLRYTFLLLAVACISGIIDTAMSLPSDKGSFSNAQLVIIGLYGLSVLLIAYVAGRFDRIKQNCVPLILITAAQIAISVLFISSYGNWKNILYIIWDSSTCLLWIDLMIAYILRYKAHREAGLADK